MSVEWSSYNWWCRVRARDADSSSRANQWNFIMRCSCWFLFSFIYDSRWPLVGKRRERMGGTEKERASQRETRTNWHRHSRVYFMFREEQKEMAILVFVIILKVLLLCVFVYPWVTFGCVRNPHSHDHDYSPAFDCMASRFVRNWPPSSGDNDHCRTGHVMAADFATPIWRIDRVVARSSRPGYHRAVVSNSTRPEVGWRKRCTGRIRLTVGYAFFLTDVGSRTWSERENRHSLTYIDSCYRQLIGSAQSVDRFLSSRIW